MFHVGNAFVDKPGNHYNHIVFLCKSNVAPRRRKAPYTGVNDRNFLGRASRALRVNSVDREQEIPESLRRAEEPKKRGAAYFSWLAPQNSPVA
jgi:hypothetical protein